MVCLVLIYGFFRVHLGFYVGFLYGSFRVSPRVSLGFHLGYKQERIKQNKMKNKERVKTISRAKEQEV